MSKSEPAKVDVVSQPAHVQRVYTRGEKVNYTWQGRELPCVVVNSHQTGEGKSAVVNYTVQGDISGSGYPSGAPSGPFNEVTEKELSDR